MSKWRRPIDSRRWERERLAEGRRILKAMAWATGALIASVFVLFVAVDSQPSTYHKHIPAADRGASRLGGSLRRGIDVAARTDLIFLDGAAVVVDAGR